MVRNMYWNASNPRPVPGCTTTARTPLVSAAASVVAPDTATVVRFRDGDALITDGPYAEGKEHVGGFLIVQAPDLDGALRWAHELARLTTLPIEVRPFQGEVEG